MSFHKKHSHGQKQSIYHVIISKQNIAIDRKNQLTMAFHKKHSHGQKKSTNLVITSKQNIALDRNNQFTMSLYPNKT